MPSEVDRSDGGHGSAEGENVVRRLARWQQFGAVWRVASRTSGTVTISLCRCDGGEEIDTLTSNDPSLLGWLADRSSSEQ